MSVKKVIRLTDLQSLKQLKKYTAGGGWGSFDGGRKKLNTPDGRVPIYLKAQHRTALENGQVQRQFVLPANDFHSKHTLST